MSYGSPGRQGEALQSLCLVFGDLVDGSLKPLDVVWKVPRALINIVAKIGDLLHLPLNTFRLDKLTENYVVSNAKIKSALGISSMPVDARDGLIRTIKSFQNQ